MRGNGLSRKVLRILRLGQTFGIGGVFAGIPSDMADARNTWEWLPLRCSQDLSELVM